jgi:hypothetical protein
MKTINVLIFACLVALLFPPVMAQAQALASSTQNTASQTSVPKLALRDPHALQQYNQAQCDRHFHLRKIPQQYYGSFMKQCMQTRRSLMHVLPNPGTTTAKTAAPKRNGGTDQDAAPVQPQQ